MNTNKPSILPKSIQSEINTGPTGLTRDELKQKLRDKIAMNKQQNNKPSQQVKNKLEKDAKKEKKEVDNDPRVTYKMKHLFITALRTYPGMDLANPHEILEKKEKYTLDYYNFCIKLLKDNNNDQDMLKNPYCEYMKEVLEIN
jgi:hypothetical protein